MRYIGSKKNLLDFIGSSIVKVIDAECKIFCDLFAGTGIVGSYFKNKGYSIISNDLQYYSYVLNRNIIGNNKHLLFDKLETLIPNLSSTGASYRKYSVCEYLSNLAPVEGFIYKEFCQGGTADKDVTRLYFSDSNGKLCDAIRIQIEQWRVNNLVSDDEYYFLLASLLSSIGSRANTTGIYGAFLKKFNSSSSLDMTLVPNEFNISPNTHQVYNDPANVLVKKINTDIMYLDPPYNHRQYASNYHLLETIARYDNPALTGIAGLRDCSKQKSLYCSKTQVAEHFEELITNIKAKYIFLSYNNEGLMSLDDIKRIMGKRGEYGCIEQVYQRYKADKTEAREHKAASTIEYLHYIKCNTEY